MVKPSSIQTKTLQKFRLFLIACLLFTIRSLTENILKNTHIHKILVENES